MSNFRKMLRNGSRIAVRKKFQTLKYEHIIYSFEARDLEIFWREKEVLFTAVTGHILLRRVPKRNRREAG